MRNAFRKAVAKMLEDHLGPEVASRFKLIYESEVFDTRETFRQKQDEHFILEVHYQQPSGLLVYICDVASFWSRGAVEYQLLSHITDKVKTGVIGQDWVVASDEIASGKYETPDDGATLKKKDETTAN